MLTESDKLISGKVRIKGISTSEPYSCKGVNYPNGVSVPSSLHANGLRLVLVYELHFGIVRIVFTNAKLTQTMCKIS